MEPFAKPRSKPKSWVVRGTKQSAFFFLILLVIPLGNRNRSSERPFECFCPSKKEKAACKHLVKVSASFQSKKDPESPIKLR